PMKRLSFGLLTAAAIALLAGAVLVASREPAAGPVPAAGVRVAAPGAAPAMSLEATTATLRQYCATCHSDRARAGGLTLAGFDAARAHLQAEVAEKIIRKLRAGMMPPPGARRPDAATVN